MKLQVRCNNGESFDIDVNVKETVSELKQRIESKSGIEVDRQRLIFRGKVMQDFDILETYEIEEGFAIHLVKGKKKIVENQGINVPIQQPQTNAQPQQPQNPLNNMENNPFFQSMLNNPDLMSQIMLSNPQMQQMITNYPELGELMRDPQLMRESLRIAQNPSLMREMMRNSDVAMNNIEQLPGGFDALRRFYHDIQQPIAEATSDPSFLENAMNVINGGNPTAPSTQTSNNNNNNQSEAAPGGAIPNPWSNNNTNASSPFGGFGGMGGFGGLPGMEGMDPQQAHQQMQTMMQNPMYRSMVEMMLSDPQFIESMIQMNPQLQAMVNSNPMMGSMIRNPALMRMMFEMQGLLPPASGAANNTTAPNTTPNPFAGLGGLSGLFGMPRPNPQAFGENLPPNTNNAQSANNISASATATATTSNPSTNNNTSSAPQPTQTQQPPMNPWANLFSGGFGGGLPNLFNRPAAAGATTASATSAPSNPFLNMGMNPFLNNPFLGGMGMNPFGGASASANAPSAQTGTSSGVKPLSQMTKEELKKRFEKELVILQEMGFLDESSNIDALKATGGNINLAVDWLLSHRTW